MSRLPFELFLALRYLRPKRTFVSVITLISILGVTLGVAVLIIVISVMSGFDHDLREKILGFKPHLTVVQWDEAEQHVVPMKNYDAVAGLIAQNKNVRGVAPFIAGPVLVETEGTTNRAPMQDAPMLRGVDPANEGSISQLPQEIVAGKFDLRGHGMVVGADFANNLKLAVGDHLSVLSESAVKKMREAYKRKEEFAISPDDYTVTGVFSTGYYDFDAHAVLVSLDNAQELYGLDDAAHGLFVTLKDPNDAALVRSQLHAQLLQAGQNPLITTWMENDAIFSALVVEKNMMFYLLFFIVLVAALCILSAQITFVIQKTREIGMLKALGATKLQISGIFLAQSAIIGVIGVASGYGLGMLAVTYRNEFLHFMRRATGWELFPASVYGFGELPALITPRDVAIICISSFVICIFGGLLPAIRAGSLKPVEALRYE
jgi:lipoprotein-releasing system permease protein